MKLQIFVTAIQNVLRNPTFFIFWKGLPILNCMYLLVLAYLQYNWDPDDQTPIYNLIMSLVFLGIAFVRLTTPGKYTVPLLIFLDLFLVIIASRAILNHSFWDSILPVLTNGFGFLSVAIFVLDYTIRNSQQVKSKAF
jgi:hypothetical protein